MGQPSILWPETAIESTGLRKDISGAYSTNGIIMAKSAPSQCTCTSGDANAGLPSERARKAHAERMQSKRTLAEHARLEQGWRGAGGVLRRSRRAGSRSG